MSVLLTASSPLFPDFIRSADPFWTGGNCLLLSEPAVGICGSRDASEAGIKHAREFGRTAAENGFTVVSGYARGVDTAAHLGALEAGGKTIAVLPEGIMNFRVRRELKALATSENLLAVSCLAPDAPWTSWNAMGRNKIIVGLSSALFVIEAGERGGTINAGLECLRQAKLLCVLEYKAGHEQPPGNRLLLEKSGKAVRTKRDLKGILARLLNSNEVRSRQPKLEFV
jgi:DNA processing protein